MLNDINDSMLIMDEKIGNISREIETIKKESKGKRKYPKFKNALDEGNGRIQMTKERVNKVEDGAIEIIMS